MPQKIRMWEVTAENSLNPITSSEISSEERLEDWLESDISMLDPDLLVIGRQVRTDFNKYIDLLCLDSTGGPVVVELKKGLTPWQVTAQALDYASWVKDLSHQRIKELAEAYLEGPLEEAFFKKFRRELPETLNKSHRSLIVAEAMDASTERIVRYLSDMEVPINVATVQHFRDRHGREILAQVFLIEPEVAAAKADSVSKRRGYSFIPEIQESADESGVGGLYRHLVNNSSGVFGMFANARNLGFRPPHGSGIFRTLFDVNPKESSAEAGLKFRLNGVRLADYFGLTMDQIKQMLPESHEDLPHTGWRNLDTEEIENWVGFQGYFRTTEEIDRFLDALKQ